MRKKALMAGVGIAVAASAAAIVLAPVQPADGPATVQHQAQRNHTGDAPLLAGLPTRKAIGPAKADLFFSEQPPKPPPAAISPPAPPTLPPMPYRVAGQVVHDGRRNVILAKDDRVFAVREGEVLDGAYRVQAIKSDSVTLVYVPLDTPQVLAIATALNAESAQGASPAQLRWDGPKQVRTGDRFEVALKMTSRQAVRAAPMQIHFDVDLLEPIEVRPGGVFLDGTFDYRILPGGSIFVGASGKAVVTGDDNLLVVSFRSIRPSVAAELHISTLTLQGADGKPIRHQNLAAFRTTILH